MADLLFDNEPQEPRASAYLVDHSSAARGLEGIEPTLAQKADALAQSYQAKFGEPLKLTSAFRTEEHQARLYAEDVAAHGGQPSGYVAPGGKSSHSGRAIDIDKAQAAKIPDAVLSELGLHRPMKGQGKSGVNEPWHLQEIPEGGIPAGQKQWHPDELKVMADQKADQYGIPRDIFRALIGHESQWKHDAANPTSSALGLGQFLDNTNEDYKLGLNVVPRGKGGKVDPNDERLHPEKALDAAARLLLAKPGATWADRVKNYGEGTDAYLAKVMKQAEIDQKTPPSENELRLAHGLPMGPVPKTPVNLGDRILGNLGVGVSESTGRAIGIGQTLGAAEAAGPVHGFTPAPLTSAEELYARRETEEALMPAVGQKVKDQPAESWLGQLGEGLVRTVPELPLFYGAGEAVNIGLRGASLLPRVGPHVAKLADYLAPEAVKAASLIGSLPRIAGHGALTGAVLGASTAIPGERLEKAGEEALGFAVAAPAFHLAGKAIFGLGKGIGKAIVGTPPNFRMRSDAEAKFENISAPLGFREARKAAKAEGVELIRIDKQWHTGERIGGAEPPKVDIPASDITGPTFDSVEAASKAGDTTPFPSGAKADVVVHADGSASLVPDYSIPGSLGESPADFRLRIDRQANARLEEIRAERAAAEAAGLPWPPEVAKSPEIAAAEAAGFGPAPMAPRQTLVEEVQAAQGAKRADVPTRKPSEAPTDLLRSDLNEAALPDELNITVSDRNVTKAEARKAGKSPERDRVYAELEASFPGAAEKPQELAVIKAVHDASARRFEKLGQGTREDYYKGLEFKLGEQQPGVNEAFYAKDGRFVTEFMPSTNISTAFHAAWHYIENTLPKDYIAELSKWRGKDYSTWETADFEHTARAFELFWAEGKVSQRALEKAGITRKVAKIFSDVKEWMLNVYGQLKGSDIDVALNPELENIFRKALGLKELKAEAASVSGDVLTNLQAKFTGLAKQHATAVERFGKNSPEVEAIRAEAAGVQKELKAALEGEKEAPAKPVERKLTERQVEAMGDAADEALGKASAYEKELGRDNPITQEAVMDYQRKQAAYNKATGEGPTDAGKVLFQESPGGKEKIDVNDRVVLTKYDGTEVEGNVVAIKPGDWGGKPLYIIKDSDGTMLGSTREVSELRKVTGKEPTESARVLYQRAGHLDALSRDVDTLQNHTIDRAAVDQEKVLYQASSTRSAKAEAKVAAEQAKKLKLEAATAEALKTQIGRAHESGAKMMELSRVWDFGPEEVTRTLKKGVLTNLAKELGMEKEVTLAEQTGKLMELYRSMYDRVRERVEAAKSPDLGTVEPGQIPAAIAEMSKINDTVDLWHKSFVENANYMLKESPQESALKAVGSWIEDHLGYAPKALEKYTKAAYEGFVNMQHYARNMPVLKPLLAMGWKMGSTIKQIEKGLLEGDVDASVKGWSWGVDAAGKKVKVERDVKLTGIKSYSDLRGDRPELADIADKLMLAADRDPKSSPLTAEGALAKLEGENLPLSDKLKVAQAIGDVRETLDYTYFKLRDQYEGSLEGLSEKSIAARMRSWDKEHEYHPNYFPHIREGSMVIQVRDPISGKTLYSTRTDGGRKLAQLKEKLKADYPGMDVGDFTASQSSRGGISGMWLTQFATSVEQKAAKEGTLKEAQPFIDMIHKMVKEFGLRGHYIARSSAEGIPGFEENVGKALISYGKLFATHMGKAEFVQGAAGEIASLKGYGRVQDYARRWVELALQPSNQLDSAIAVAKNVAFMKYIGGVLKTAVVTTFDKITNAYPMMGMYVDNPKSLMVGGYRDGAKFMMWERGVRQHLEGLRGKAEAAGVPFNEIEGLKAARAAVELPAAIEPWIKEGILQARKTGQLDPVFTDIILEGHRSKMDLMSQKLNMTGTAESYLKHGWNKSLEWSGKLIGTTESYGRLTTMISAMRMFKQLGFSEADAIAAGGRFMLDAHGYYGKINLPLWMQEKGVAQLAKLPFTFRVFEHHYINLIGGLLSGQQGKAGRVAAAKSLGLLAGLGGMMSLPFFTTVGKLFREATGTDPEQYVRKQLNNIDNSQTLADMFSYGVPASGLGIGMPAISLRSSTEVGKIRAEELILGAPGQAVQDVAKGVSGAMSGDWNQFFDAVAPTVLKNPKRAYERYYYGALGASGKKLTEGPGGEPIKYTAGEAAGQVFGFTPSKMDKYYQQSEVAIADKEYWASQRKTLYSRLQRAFNTGDEDRMESIFQDIATYNQKASSLGPDIVLITPQEIRQSLKDRIEKKKFLQAERLGIR